MMEGFKEIKPNDFEAKMIKLIGSDWMLVTAGTSNHYNTMTAAWGGLGFLWNKPVSFIFVRPQRYTYEFTEKYINYTLSFFDHKKYKKALNYCGTKSGRDVDKMKETGLTAIESADGNIGFEQATVIIECKKLYADDIKEEKFVQAEVDKKVYPLKDYHRMYIGEIEHIWIKE